MVCSFYQLLTFAPTNPPAHFTLAFLTHGPESHGYLLQHRVTAMVARPGLTFLDPIIFSPPSIFLGP